MNSSRPSTTADDPEGQADASPRRLEREVIGEEIHRHEGADEQRLVGERIEQPAEVGLLFSRTSQLPVDVVGDARDREEHERD
jgi:hypothetical protein